MKKSSILFSNGADNKTKRRIKTILGFKGMKKDAVNLGNSLVFGRQRVKEFDKLKEKVQGRLESWQSQLLSRAGKATLIKSVVQSIPTYTMATFHLLVFICQDLDAMVRRFW